MTNRQQLPVLVLHGPGGGKPAIESIGASARNEEHGGLPVSAALRLVSCPGRKIVPAKPIAKSS